MTKAKVYINDKWCAIIDSSFLSDELIARYKQLIAERIGRIKR